MCDTGLAINRGIPFIIAIIARKRIRHPVDVELHTQFTIQLLIGG